MSTFILIARYVGKISGEKIYHYNKLKYMAAHGWRTIVFTGNEEEFFSINCSEIEHYVIPSFVYTPECYSAKEVYKTINTVVDIVKDGSDDFCLIESDAVNRAVWAELIAKRINAVHLAFLLQERHTYKEDVKQFLKFKYDRHELAGITKQSIGQMFSDNNLIAREDGTIAAYCNNVVEDCTDDYSRLLNSSAMLTLGSIGRLDKACVDGILNGFVGYAQKYPDYIFNVVLIGGARSKKRIYRIKKLFKNINNINLIITGTLYPIPVSLLQNIDVFVSTAGSANVSYRCHRPTLKVHPITGEPVGIIGLDMLYEKTMYDTLQDTDICKSIDRAINQNENIKYIYNYYDDYYHDMSQEFERQLLIARNSEKQQKREYYSEDLLLQIKPAHIIGHLFHRIIGRFFGPKILNQVVNIVKMIVSF